MSYEGNCGGRSGSPHDPLNVREERHGARVVLLVENLGEALANILEREVGEGLSQAISRS